MADGVNEQEQIQGSFYPPCDCGGRMAADSQCQAIIHQPSFFHSLFFRGEYDHGCEESSYRQSRSTHEDR